VLSLNGKKEVNGTETSSRQTVPCAGWIFDRIHQLSGVRPTEIPGPGEQHWFGGRALAGVDLAAIRLRAGALDAAAAALELPLSLPSAQRINAVTTRLDLVRTELAGPDLPALPASA
jgi:hypothetical protein